MSVLQHAAAVYKLNLQWCGLGGSANPFIVVESSVRGQFKNAFMVLEQIIVYVEFVIYNFL